MLSKRANVFYLEHVRVLQKDDRVVYMTQSSNQVEQIVNIPDKNTAFVLLGKGSSITDAAVRMLAESNVIVGFTGSGGSPMHGIMDPVFLTPQDEYRPTEYMQHWVRFWLDDEVRLSAAKDFLRYRLELSHRFYPQVCDFDLSPALVNDFQVAIEETESVELLLTAEARYAKQLYAVHANAAGVRFTRTPGEGRGDEKNRRANGFLDHGNYIAYGYAAAALHVLGISYAFPVLHGKTRRGALVFDVADLVKDWLIMPAAFEAAKRKAKDQAFRAMVIDRAMKYEVLDILIPFLKSVAMKYSEFQ